MKLKTIFLVDRKKLAFFAKLLEINKESILSDANKELISLEELWNQKSSFVEGLFSKVFDKADEIEIKIFVFPQYFYLGSTETQNQIILFGQPSRTDTFSLAIIVHEICHIFLSKIKIERPMIIDEIICLMLEDYIYSVFDRRSLATVWDEDELDLFHLNAMKIAIKEINDKGPIINRDIQETIGILIEQLDAVSLNIKPKKGLIKTLLSKKRNGRRREFTKK